MEGNEMLLKEWEKNVDLYIHHDNLKQNRVRHWLSTQAIFFAAVGLLIVHSAEGAGKEVERLFVLILAPVICFVGFFTTELFRRADARARLFTLFHRYNLCRIESKAGLETFRRLGVTIDGKSQVSEFAPVDGVAEQYLSEIRESLPSPDNGIFGVGKRRSSLRSGSATRKSTPKQDGVVAQGRTDTTKPSGTAPASSQEKRLFLTLEIAWVVLFFHSIAYWEVCGIRSFGINTTVLTSLTLVIFVAFVLGVYIGRTLSSRPPEAVARKASESRPPQ